MDERHLLLLGILKTENLHGYHITEFIERNLSNIIALKKTTAYSMLDRMVEQGYLDMHMEQEGNRPQRKVYSMTEKGDEAFQTLLLNNVGSVGEMNLPQEIGITFIDHLPRDVAISQLENKLVSLESMLQKYEKAPAHSFGIGTQLAIEHRIAILRAEKQWLVDVMKRLKAESQQE